MLSSVEEYQEKKLLEEGLSNWLTRHIGSIRAFADEHIAYESRDEFIRYAIGRGRFPMYMILKNVYDTDEEKFLKILKKIKYQRGRIDIIVGGKGSGKTYIAHVMASWLAESGEKLWWFGPPCDLPDFYNDQTMDITQLPENSTAILDEAGLRYFSRDSMTMDQSDFMKRLATLRHSGRNFIVITQNLRIQDVNFIRLVNSITFTSFSIIEDKEKRVRLHEELKVFMPTKIGRYLYVDNDDITFYSYPLEDWWKEEYSTPYRNFKNDAEAYRYIFRLLSSMDDQQIVEQLANKSYRMTKLDIMRIRFLVQDEDTSKFDSWPDRDVERYVSMGFNDLPINDMLPHTGKHIKGNFGIDSMQELAFQKELEGKSEEYQMRFDFNINEHFLSSLESNIRDNLDIKLSVIGRPGTGKSLAAISISHLIYNIQKKKFKLNIYSRKEKLMEDIKQQKQEVFILDEVFNITGTGSGRESGEFQNMEEALRQRQIHFIHTSPQVKTVMHYYILKTAGIDKKNNLCKLLVYVPPKDLLGYITVKKPPKHIIDEYKKFKEQTLTTVGKRQTSSKDHIAEAAKQVIASKEWANATTRAQRFYVIKKVCPHLSTGECDDVLSHISIYKLS